MVVSMMVNGTPHSVNVSPLTRLLDVLRDVLALTGTKEGCGEGECGTCTVLLDGEPVNACLVPIGQCEGRSILTIEGIHHTKLGPILADTFVERGGVQCGICTPGMIVSAHALLSVIPNPSEAQIREAMAGNICRCTGYQGIVEAVQAAAERAQGERAQGERAQEEP